MLPLSLTKNNNNIWKIDGSRTPKLKSTRSPTRLASCSGLYLRERYQSALILSSIVFCIYTTSECHVLKYCEHHFQYNPMHYKHNYNVGSVCICPLNQNLSDRFDLGLYWKKPNSFCCEPIYFVPTLRYDTIAHKYLRLEGLWQKLRILKPFSNANNTLTCNYECFQKY